MVYKHELISVGGSDVLPPLGSIHNIRCISVPAGTLLHLHH